MYWPWRTNTHWTCVSCVLRNVVTMYGAVPEQSHAAKIGIGEMSTFVAVKLGGVEAATADRHK